MKKLGVVMHEQPIISVIIPIYNTAEYLPRCLDSVLNNTYRKLEVICVNDGSTDNSGSILAQYAQRDDRIVLITQKNAGLSAARNAGLDAATGVFIAFIDSDDWIHSQYFEVLMRGCEQENANIVACNYRATSEFELNQHDTYDLNKIDYSLLELEGIVKNGTLKRLVWGRIFARNVISNIRFDPKLQWGEDTTFNFQVILSGENIRFSYVDLPLYFYYLRASSISNTICYERRLRLPRWYLEHYGEFRSEKAQRYVLEQACREVLSSRYAEMFNPMRKEVVAECRKISQGCINALKKSRIVPPLKALEYRILFRLPSLYRMIRILNDRTLVAWEKNAKSRNREC